LWKRTLLWRVQMGRHREICSFERFARLSVALLLALAGLAASLVVAAPSAQADPPVFTSVPQDILLEASDAAGAYINFALPSASDDNGAPHVSCDPSPGDFFPVGQTTATCTATDVATDDSATTSFHVRVLPRAQERAASGSVRALFYYTKTTNSFGLRVFKNLRLTILRGEAIAFSAAVPRYSDRSRLPAYPAGYGEKRSLFLRDLDGDGEPEALLDLFWGGAHCCFWSDVYRYGGGSYRLAHHFWGDAFYRLVDLNGDGRPEFVSGDDSFAYAFAAFAFSLFPLQIWSYQSGRFGDVTRRYPDRIRRDAARDWRQYLRLRGAHYETEGAAAAWAADEYLLHHRAVVWRRLKPLARAGKLQGNYPPLLFVRNLRLFLARHGYR
jgi:HYR domain